MRKLTRHDLENMASRINALYNSRLWISPRVDPITWLIQMLLIDQSIDRTNELIPTAWFLSDPDSIIGMINNAGL